MNIHKSHEEALNKVRDQILSKRHVIQELEYQVESQETELRHLRHKLDNMSFDIMIEMGVSPHEYAISLDNTKIEKRHK